ncbi:SMP-30/gluconolactonase/LRE family protein [Rhodococcus sp. ARC_M12]|uniref:SMP-30/gluconolactonase/LRE family protein n=1 Tax=Rhodococcus sp. ARC_M12 TaxID=2928854 RepID=UPI001FB200A4|nr:SMP-30/gluconolactonase/LRE family protein [Rhodococcus sp. ARC_M12]MCJ0977762.1 SMP-30/gluconolactonase/LRE family protein [Rhodococcus sp. ARC_M12]
MTRSTDITTVVDDRAFLECPRWHDGRIWVSDLYAHEVLSIGDDGDIRVEATVAGRPSGLGWLPDGRLLIVSMTDGLVLRRELDGSIVTHADVSALATGKLNDMVVDDRGHAYISTFGFEFRSRSYVESAVLIHVSPSGDADVAAGDLLFPNGSVVTKDRTLVVAESMGNRMTAFDIADDGSLSNRRTWAAFGPEVPRTSVKDAMSAAQVAPDGIGLDSEGAIWVADALHQKLIRVVEGGEIVDEKVFPTGVFACMLGGRDGRTLFACAAPSSSERERENTRDASLLSVRVDVPA